MLFLYKTVYILTIINFGFVTELPYTYFMKQK